MNDVPPSPRPGSAVWAPAVGPAVPREAPRVTARAPALSLTPGLQGALVAFILNNVGQAVNPAATGPFDSHFANLSFGEKAAVFAVMESGQAGAELIPLGGALPWLTGFIAYSEAGLLAPDFCTLSGVPVGWANSGYTGPADGHDDFQGYFEGRTSTV